MPRDCRRISPLLLLLFGCAGSRPMELEAAEGQSARPPRAAEKSEPPAASPAPQPKAGPSKAVKSQTVKGESAKAGAAPPGQPPLSRKPAAAPRDGAAAEEGLARTPAEEVAALIRDLRDQKSAEAAFRKIWEAPREWIPEL